MISKSVIRRRISQDALCPWCKSPDFYATENSASIMHCNICGCEWSFPRVEPKVLAIYEQDNRFVAKVAGITGYGNTSKEAVSKLKENFSYYIDVLYSSENFDAEDNSK